MRNYFDVKRDREEAARQFGVSTNTVIYVQCQLIETFRTIENARGSLSENALRNLGINTFDKLMKACYTKDELLSIYPLLNKAWNKVNSMVDGKSVELFY